MNNCEECGWPEPCDCEPERSAGSLKRPGSAITEALKAAATLALTCKNVPLATEFTMRAKEHIAERELLDWAETLLCNAECPKHCTPEYWLDRLKCWRDQKHGVSPNLEVSDRRTVAGTKRQPEQTGGGSLD